MEPSQQRPAVVTPINRPANPVPPSATMTELSIQLGKMQTIERHLKERIQAEGMALLQEHDRRYTEIQHDYARRIHEAVTALENERDQALRDVNEVYFDKKRELERVALHVT